MNNSHPTPSIDPISRAEKILIVGAGAIGCLVGARLSLSGHEITLVGRDALRAAIAEEGLTIITDGSPDTTRHLVVVTSTASAFANDQQYDWIFLTPKAFDVATAATELRAAASAIPPVITLQNGLGSEEIAASILGAENIIAGTLTIPVEVLSRARLNTISKGGIGLAPWHPTSPDPAPLATILRHVGVRTTLYDDPHAMKWTKLLLNMIGNATSAILALPPQQIFAHPHLYDIELNALTEARRVMRTKAIKTIPLPSYPAHLQFAALEYLPRWLTRPIMSRLVAKARGGKMPSLYLGLQAGRKRSEIEVLNGAVVAAGKQIGVPTPTNRTLTRLVTQLATGEQQRAPYRHNPDALLKEITTLS
ncbi:MAG: ketopantoate reductase family protein [Ardenticatenaceae bacterium]